MAHISLIEGLACPQNMTNKLFDAFCSLACRLLMCSKVSMHWPVHAPSHPLSASAVVYTVSQTNLYCCVFPSLSMLVQAALTSSTSPAWFHQLPQLWSNPTLLLLD
jgi:hypothetical protein